MMIHTYYIYQKGFRPHREPNCTHPLPVYRYCACIKPGPISSEIFSDPYPVIQ